MILVMTRGEYCVALVGISSLLTLSSTGYADPSDQFFPSFHNATLDLHYF